MSQPPADSSLLPYVAILGGLGLSVALTFQLTQGNVFRASILGLTAVVMALAVRGLGLGMAGIAAAVPCLVFVIIVFGLPLAVVVDRELFSAAAQAIPALFIGFAIESGVVRHRTRPEVRAIAVILAILLSVGEGAALSGIAKVDPPTISPSGLIEAEPAANFSWQLTITVAAITAGFLSIIISMLIRQEPETPQAEDNQQRDVPTGGATASGCETVDAVPPGRKISCQLAWSEPMVLIPIATSVGAAVCALLVCRKRHPDRRPPLSKVPD